MQVQPVAAAPVSEKPRSYIERFMQGLAKRVMELALPILIWLGWYTPPPVVLLPIEEPLKKEISEPPEPVPDSPPAIDVSFEIHLLKGLQLGSIAPPMVLRHFQQRVSPEKQVRIFESLGQQEMAFLDQLFRRSLSDIGRRAVDQNPYLIVSHLEKALRKQIALVAL